MSARPRLSTPVGRYLSLRITVIYAIVAGLWIFLSDSALQLVLSPGASSRTFSSISIIKGLAFVLVTSLLLHALIRNGLNTLRRSEVTLMDSERRLSDIISFLPDATLVVDREGKVIAWNRAMEEISGVPASDMLGKGNREYAVPFYGERRLTLIDMVLDPDLEVTEKYEMIGRESKTLVAEVFLPNFRPGGTYMWVKASPLCDSQGNLIGAVEALRDVTEHKRAEEDRRTAEARQRETEAAAEEAKQQFYQRTIFAVTGGKLNLVSHSEIEKIMAADSRSFELRNEDDLSRVRVEVSKAGEELGMGAERVYALATAVGEAAANAVKHARGGTVRLGITESVLQVCVLDNGSGMDHLTLPKATLLARFSTKASMGLGYSLILGLVDTVYLATDDGGTDVLMEQAIQEPVSEISLDTLPDTW